MLDRGGVVLGVFSSWNYEEAAVELNRGDRLLLFTDGITEATNANGQEFEEASIGAFAKANAALSARQLTSQLLAQVTGYCSGQFQDDATLLVIAAD
jgi:sigma-B regulation protein RsbU (phosphoserine phosphatase)